MGSFIISEALISIDNYKEALMIKKTLSIRSAAIASLFIVTIAVLHCGCVTPKKGTPADALAARIQINEGRAFLATVRNEMEDLLLRLASLNIVYRLMLGTDPVLQSDLTNAFGTYLETAPGQFSLRAEGTTLLVQFQNGLDMRIHSFTFTGTPARVERFRGEVSSNNRNIITPTTEAVDIQATGIRPDIADDLVFFSSPRVVLQGTIAYFRDGTNVLYEVTRSTGELNASIVGNTLAEITSSSEFRIRDLSDSTNSRPYWHETQTLLYRPITDSANWVAVSLSIDYDDYTLSNGSVGARIDYNKSIGGQIAYLGVGSAYLDNRLVATVTGGPYFCDANDVTSTGSGDTVVVHWFDQVDQPVIPSTDFSCSKLIVVQPM
jgi:hypothetical protein